MQRSEPEHGAWVVDLSDDAPEARPLYDVAEHTRRVLSDPRVRRCFRCDPPLPGMGVCPGVEA